jgi:hypothetical protein
MALGVFYYSFPILGALAGAGVDKRPWRYLGVALGVGGIVAFSFQLADGQRIKVWNIPTLLFSLSFVIAHANVLTLYPLKKIQRVVPVLSFILGGFACGLAYYLSETSRYLSNSIRGDDIERLLLMCLSILTFCGTAATLLLAAVNKKAERPKVVYTPVQKMQVVCPCCGEKQELAPGEGRCVKCRLVIKTAYEEPKCETCGYSLLMLGSDKCPECGTVAPWGIAKNL